MHFWWILWKNNNQADLITQIAGASFLSLVDIVPCYNKSYHFGIESMFCDLQMLSNPINQYLMLKTGLETEPDQSTALGL